MFQQGALGKWGDSMKKALCITGSMNAGGAQTFMMKIMRNLDMSRYTLDFCVSIDEEGFFDKEILTLGGKIHHITSKTENSGKFKKELKELLREEKYDTVIRMGDTCFSFFDLFIAKRCGVPRVVFRSCNSNFIGRKTQLIIHKLLRNFLSRFIDVRVAPSTEAARFTFGNSLVNKGEVQILHNGLELKKYEYSDRARKTIRKEFNLTNKFVIGHVGRFNLQKNHSFLIEIFACIEKKRDDAVLMLVGNGELESEIKKKVIDLKLTDKVIFTGIRKDIGGILSAMDVFAFPSYFEGMPNTVIEAQANGLHCMVSDSITKEANITGLVDYIPLEKSAEEWARKIICTDIQHKQVYSDFISNEYDIESVVTSFIKYVF